MAKLVSFGEIMLRMHTKENLRFRQAFPGALDVTFGGAEANAAVAYSQLGGRAAFVTALPAHVIADACVGTLRNLGVDVSRIVRTDNGRLGIYFVEPGANQRASSVIYDRDASAISLAPPDTWDWDGIFSRAGKDGGNWFHITGITPSLSANAAAASLRAVEAAKRNGFGVSVDLNFRKKLWRWERGTAPEKLAGRVMAEILDHAGILFANEEDIGTVLGIRAEESDFDSGSLVPEKYPAVARQVASRFPGLEKICVTLRESHSANDNNWGAMFLDVVAETAWFAPMKDGAYAPYRISSIVDRIGAGDAFAGAFLYALGDRELSSDPEDPLRFAAACSCLAHSVWGDFSHVTKDEALSLMGGKTSGRIER
jgi:2-dehydro-3-deoxygluconokinase